MPRVRQEARKTTPTFKVTFTRIKAMRLRRLLEPPRLYIVCFALVVVTFTCYRSYLPETSFLQADTVHYDYKQRTNIRNHGNELIGPNVSIDSGRPTNARVAKETPLQHSLFKNCSDNLCQNLLCENDKLSLMKCPLRKPKGRPHSSFQRGKCKFMNGNGRHRVALTSAPGSGNTWVRELLERVTGVCTGSVYCDQSLKRSGFNGEGLHGSGVIVVKTHEAPPDTWMNRSIPMTDGPTPNFQSAILIVRNPFDALVSEWTRQKSGGHVAAAQGNIFGRFQKWHDYVKGKGLGFWKVSLNLWYLNNDNHPLLIVHYEDLKRDVVNEVKRMLNFLQFQYTDKLLNTALAEDCTSFKRIHKSDETVLDLFTEEQKSMVNDVIQKAIDSMIMKKNDTLCIKLWEYLRT